MISSFDLIDKFGWNTSFTRFDKKTASYTLIDGILISRSLISSVHNVRIAHYGDNVSDHIPVELDLHVMISEANSIKTRALPYVNWSKLSTENISSFRQKMTENLDAISFMSTNIRHGNQACTIDCHKFEIENYYDAIVAAVVDAESCLPKTDPNLQRSFWNENLSTLKRQSIDCTKYWRSMGCPTSGPSFDCKRDCSLKYKTQVRRLKSMTEHKKC